MTDFVMPQDTALQEDSLPTVLGRLVSELQDVAYLIERVEPQVLELGGDQLLQHPDSIKILQGIDLAVQKTRALPSSSRTSPPPCRPTGRWMRPSPSASSSLPT